MNYLILDTSTSGTIVAVFEDGKPLKTVRDADNTKQNEHLPVIVKSVMEELAMPFKAIDKILVTKGPGSFTGIRIGLSFARGLSLSLGTEVVGIDNFDALRGNCRIDKEVLVAIDSRKGDWFMKTPTSFPVSGGVETAKSMIAGMKNPKIISYRAGRLGELLGIDMVLETSVTAFGIMNAYMTLSKLADTSPAPLYIRPADVTLKSK